MEINVPYTEAMEYKQRIIDRMFPLDTVMDLVSEEVYKSRHA